MRWSSLQQAYSSEYYYCNFKRVSQALASSFPDHAFTRILFRSLHATCFSLVFHLFALITSRARIVLLIIPKFSRSLYYFAFVCWSRCIALRRLNLCSSSTRWTCHYDLIRVTGVGTGSQNWKATVRFFISVCPSAWNCSAATGRISMKYDYFSEICRENSSSGTIWQE